MYSLYVCLMCMPYMYALHVMHDHPGAVLRCMYALYACLIWYEGPTCNPYTYMQDLVSTTLAQYIKASAFLKQTPLPPALLGLPAEVRDIVCVCVCVSVCV